MKCADFIYWRNTKMCVVIIVLTTEVKEKYRISKLKMSAKEQKQLNSKKINRSGI